MLLVLALSFTFKVVNSLSRCLVFNARLMKKRHREEKLPRVVGGWVAGNPSLLNEDETSGLPFWASKFGQVVWRWGRR